MNSIKSFEFVVPCDDLNEALALFVDDLGFRLEVIYPADAPRMAELSLHGQRIRLDASGDGKKPRLALRGDEPAGRREPTAGGRPIPIEFVADRRALNDNAPDVPDLKPALVVTRGGADSAWHTGRAGMQYRDLIPGRLGGRFIASHIRIPDGGPVPDYVHHHHVRFQMIYCYRGWVKLVYEDQGPEFVMQAGDCVLQPPHIRHRVLECSDGFEVVEIGCPAEHETCVEHEMTLPSSEVNREREYSGQRFVFHEAGKVAWEPERADGFESRDTGIANATKGEATAVVLRPSAKAPSGDFCHDAEFLFRFLLAGRLTLHCAGSEPLLLGAGDAFVVPAGLPHSLRDRSSELRVLEVALPAAYRAEVSS